MANGKAQITDLNLTAIDANLSDYLSDVRPYEGFVQCNSPWIGGLLNNVYKKKVDGLPEGHKLVKVHNGDIYSLAIEEDGKNGFYKNGELLTKINPARIKKETYVDPFIKVESGSYITVKMPEDCEVKTVTIKEVFDFDFDYYVNEQENKIYINTFAKNGTFLQDVRFREGDIKLHIIDLSTGEYTFYNGNDREIIINGLIQDLTFADVLEALKNKIAEKFETYENFDEGNHEITKIKIDSAGVIIQTKSSFYVQSSFNGSYNKKVDTYNLAGAFVADSPSIENNNFALVRIGVNPSSFTWERGTKKFSISGFDFLYYNDILSAISINNSIITTDIQKILRIDTGYNPITKEKTHSPFVAYMDTSGNCWKLTIETPEDGFVENYIFNKFLVFNCIDYNNTYDLGKNELFCRSDDFNDRVFPYLIWGNQTRYNFYNFNIIDGFNGVGVNVNAAVTDDNSFSIQYPQSLALLTDNDEFKKIQTYDQVFNPDVKFDIDLFYSNSSGSSAKYLNSYLTELGYTIKDKNIDTTYPNNSDNNLLYNVSLLMKLTETYINESLGSENNNSYILTKTQKKEQMLGYYLFAETEVEDIFLTQGQFYGLNDKFIYSLGLDNSIVSINNVVANKQDLVFLGAFPTMALFWSKLDKSLYSFTGDSILQKIKEVYRINQIYNVYCDPARLTMIISTNIGVIIIYQNQIMLLDEFPGPVTHIYYDSNRYVLDDTLLSLSEQEDFDALPIKLQTEFYGVGGGAKSVNDCVYIRIAKNKIKNGFIKFQSFILNEKCVSSEEKKIDLNDNMFDKITGSAFIKYQPKNQAGLGFSVKIESTNPIVNMAIGHSVESIANTSIRL